MDLFRDGYDGVFKGSMAKGWLHVNKSCNERLKDRNHVWTFTPEERTRGSDERLIQFLSTSQTPFSLSPSCEALTRECAIPVFERSLIERPRIHIANIGSKKCQESAFVNRVGQ
jgi:hypothetical protein